nr:nucleic acid-binding, OB-fold protein [Tanacetum cinerariifolium]
MATTSKIDNTREDKGKQIIAEPEIIAISDLRPIHCNKTIEAVVYRKWTSKHVHTQQPIKYCCILMDKQGTPIQASMDVKDADYFDQLLQHHMVYRISGFSCEQAGLWERTLDNPTSLIFQFCFLQRASNKNQCETYNTHRIFNRDLQMFDHQTMFYNGKTLNFEGDTKRWKSNNDTDGKDVIELLTSTNNPDGAIYDHAYYGPQVLSGSEGEDQVKIGIVAVKISTGNVDGVFRDGLLRNGLQAKIVSLSLAELLLGGPLSKLTERRAPSTRKTLFKNDPEVDPSELTKKMKHDK